MPNLLLGILASSVQADYTPPITAGVAGYFGQGDESDAVFKTLFPTDSWSTFFLILPSTAGPGMSNNGVAGYIHRGFSDTFTLNDVCEKITFPTDSVSAITTILAAGGMGWGDPGNFGVWGQGLDGVSTPSDLIGIFDFATDLTTADSTILLGPNDGLGGGCDPGVAGFYPRMNEDLVGQMLLPTLTDTFGITFGLGVDTEFNTLWVDAAVAMYATRGRLSVGNDSDEVRKVALPVAAAMSTISSLPEGSAFGAAFSNDGVSGYVNQGGDFLLGASDKVFRIAYATDTWTTTTALPDGATDNAGLSDMG